MKADYAPDDRNAYTSDFQVTFFDIGLFPRREQDMTSLGYTRPLSVRSSAIMSARRGWKRRRASTPSPVARPARDERYLLDQRYHPQDNPTLVPKHESAVLWQSSMYWNF